MESVLKSVSKSRESRVLEVTRVDSRVGKILSTSTLYLLFCFLLKFAAECIHSHEMSVCLNKQPF